MHSDTQMLAWMMVATFGDGLIFQHKFLCTKKNETLGTSQNMRTDLPRSTTPPQRGGRPGGVIHSGKKFEMVFDFVPETLDLEEALFQFNILGHTSVPFLIVGQAVEPDVYFNTVCP